MPALNTIASFADEMTGWRRHLHQNPELGFECHETAAFVVERLKEFGVTDIHEGIATSGVVAIIEGQGDGPTIGLRADMDALPIVEATGAPHASKTPGVMHACGHDGHTTMLLGAAKYLAETRNFSGRVALLFQPAEEGGGGGRVMCEEGIMDRFGISQVYALHNGPLMETGHIYTRPGPMMASVAEFDITVSGEGGHGAFPHESKDAVAAALQIGQSIQTIVSRNTDANDNLVVSVTQIHGGTANNIIPASVVIGGTVRAFRKEVQDMVFERLTEICEGTGKAMGVTATLDFRREYPATTNDSAKVDFAAGVARELLGDDHVEANMPPQMAAEDFAYMLEERPGAYLVLGQGEGAFVHHPEFDFNDDIAPIGASFFARLVERAQPLA